MHPPTRTLYVVASILNPQKLSPPPFLLPTPIFLLITPPTSRRNCSSGYQMSLLLPADPGILWTRTVEPWVAGLSSYPLGNHFNFCIFTENFLNPIRSRTGELRVIGLSSYPLDHEVLVGRIISELPDEV